MLYIGLDVHSKWMTVRGFDPETSEEIYLKRVSNERESVRETFSSLKGPIHAIMESGTNSWAMYRELVGYCERLVVAEPAKLWDRRNDRKAKTDGRDALGMALKLYRGEVEPLYIPDELTQDLRVLVRGKIRISRWVTRLTNEVGSLLRSWGYVGSRSLLSKSGKSRLDEAELPVHSARVLQLWRELMEKAQEIEDELQAAIEEEAAKDDECALLQTIPNVGAFTALLVKSEIGDIRRFARSDQLISYVGLAPRVFQSGERCYYGGLGNWGNRWLRYGLGLLAQRVAGSRKDNSLRRAYWRLSFRNHKNTAKIAVARKVTRIIHQMLTKREVWDDSKAMMRKKVAA